ncbi:prepilin peptidase [Paenibacillus athensensis]|nr:A24 family peptidase [Paenibacillus athensensis]MCD1257454.1 prepilin peptidase [Paenibacillus athensensis]
MPAMIEMYEELFRVYPGLLAAVLLILGLLIGSFLNVVALRVPQGKSVVRPPSHCPNCKHQLIWLDLIPVLSYMLLRGRCRYCRSSFSARYAVYELITALIFALCGYHFGLQLELLVSLLFVSILIVIIQTDLDSLIIPDKVVFTGIGIAIVLRVFIHPLPWWNYPIAFFIGGGILFAIGWLSLILLRKEGMGGGDVKLFAFIGLIVGIKLILLSLFIASLLGTLYGLWIRWRSRTAVEATEAEAENYIPFGPFLAAGSLFAYLFGDSLIQWYISLL